MYRYEYPVRCDYYHHFLVELYQSSIVRYCSLLNQNVHSCIISGVTAAVMWLVQVRTVKLLVHVIVCLYSVRVMLSM